MNVKLFLFVICLVSVTSCSPLLKLTLGIESPTFKSNSEVLIYSEKKLKNDLPIFRIKEYNGDSIIPLNVTTIPSFRYVVNNEVKDLKTTCIADYNLLVRAPISDLNQLPTLMNISTDTLEQLLYNCSKENYRLETKDPIFYIFYANYAGFLNKRDVLPWITTLENRSDVDYVLINCDISIEHDKSFEEEGNENN